MKTTNTPKERPILFSGPMVRAILDGRKTQTRRIVNPQKHATQWPACGCKTPYGTQGDRLWVKETHQNCRECGGFNFAADSEKPINCTNCGSQLGNWRPSIFMFREWSRITLEITAVRVERLQSITESDSVAEGVIIKPDAEIASRLIRGEQGPAQLEYFALWESINGKGSWNANPWVWVVEFQKV